MSLRLSFLLLLCVCPPARAWDDATHVSIVRGAFRLSPSVESRVPVDQRDAFLEAVAKADQIDPDCRNHRGPYAKREAASEAEKALSELNSGTLSAYRRARTLGRFLHYVADCAVPTPIAQGKLSVIPDFFSNKDFILFRERRELGTPLSLSLRERGGQAQWGEESIGVHAAVFRLAVNLTIDALLLLQPAPNAEVHADLPLVIFLVNRIDNGAFTPHSQIRIGYWSPDYSAKNLRSDFLNRNSLEVVEWQKRRSGSTAIARALLFNGTRTCATKVVLKTSSWLIPVPQVEMTPQTIRAVELETPPDVTLEQLYASSEAGDCGKRSIPGAIASDYRLVLDANGSPPQFEGAAMQMPSSKIATPLPLSRRRDRHAP